MIAHVSIGVRDIDRSKRFYEAALEPLGYKCLRAARTLLGYGYGRDSIALWVVQAEHPVPADEKSGLAKRPPAARLPAFAGAGRDAVYRLAAPRCALAHCRTGSVGPANPVVRASLRASR